MAKKIKLVFTSSLQTGSDKFFSFKVSIGGVPIIYSGAVQNDLKIYYTMPITGDQPPNGISILGTLTETTEKTYNWLNTYYANDLISYSIISDSIIEMFINSENVQVSELISNNNGVGLTVETINSVVESEIKLKYWLDYDNQANDVYKLEIYQVGYKGDSKQINGNVTIEKASIKEHLDIFRGTGLSVELEASEVDSLQDLYSLNELDFPIKFYRNGILIFRGFLNSDGLYQSFVANEWRVNFKCVDGLGAIENLSFVDENGFHFVGKMSCQDVIYNCLKRTGLLMPINTSINLFYNDYTEQTTRNIFQDTFIDVSRFVKVDDNTIMSCKEVLNSVLQLFSACITQKNGEWYIFKPSELFFNQYPVFKKYDISNFYIKTFTLNINSVLGSEIDNYYPFHCGTNQQIQIKGAVSAYRINYKYGLGGSIISNTDLFHTENLIYPNWTVNPAALYNDPLTGKNLLSNPNTSYGVYSVSRYNWFNELLMTSDPIPVALGDSFTFKITYTPSIVFADMTFLTSVTQGDKCLSKNGDWLDGSFGFNTSTFREISVNIETQPTLNAEPIIIKLYTAFGTHSDMPTDAVITNQSGLKLISKETGNNIVGEFHTCKRGSGVSSIVKTNQTVYNGDNINSGFIGAVYKSDQSSLTDFWYRKQFFDSKPILRISAEESLRLNQKNLQMFKGDAYGFIEYLTVCKINNINGVFMPIEYEFDTKKNVSKIKWLELDANEVFGIDYAFTYDYGETVKPTIV